MTPYLLCVCATAVVISSIIYLQSILYTNLQLLLTACKHTLPHKYKKCSLSLFFPVSTSCKRYIWFITNILVINESWWDESLYFGNLHSKRVYPLSLIPYHYNKKHQWSPCSRKKKRTIKYIFYIYIAYTSRYLHKIGRMVQTEREYE